MQNNPSYPNLEQSNL